jgi:uncharacterized membrane protein
MPAVLLVTVLFVVLSPPPKLALPPRVTSELSRGDAGQADRTTIRWSPGRFDRAATTDPRVRRWVVWGLVAGGVGAAVLTLLREITTLVNREAVGLAALIPLVLLEATLATLVVRTVLRPRTAAPAAHNWRLWAIPAALVTGLVMFRALPTVFLQLTGFVVPGESPLSTHMLLRVIGFVLGIGLVGLTGLTLYRAAAAVPTRLPAVLASLGLLLLMVTQIVTILQFLMARRLITVPRPVFRVMVWVINHELWVLFALLALVVILPVVAWLNRRRPAYDGVNPAQNRLIRAGARRTRRYAWAALGGIGLVFLTVTLGAWADGREPQLSPPEAFAIVGNHAVVSLDVLEDGHLHRFAYTASDGTQVRFIIIKKNGVAYGVGLDACEMCGASGYYERDGNIICRLCDVIINLATIGFKGGCNPIPLDHTVTAGTLQIALADLETAAPVFA